MDSGVNLSQSAVDSLFRYLKMSKISQEKGYKKEKFTSISSFI